MHRDIVCFSLAFSFQIPKKDHSLNSSFKKEKQSLAFFHERLRKSFPFSWGFFGISLFSLPGMSGQITDVCHKMEIYPTGNIKERCSLLGDIVHLIKAACAVKTEVAPYLS